MTLKDHKPNIIQGGMGIGVSSWELARTVAINGEIGVVSGTCIDTVMIRELQEGDPHHRRAAMRVYPDQEIVDDVIDRYYVEGGKDESEPYRLLPIHQFDPSIRSQRIMSLAAFTEVMMARADHHGSIGINLMAKLKRYSLACLYGAMLAGVTAIFIGAGIPLEEAKQIPVLAAGEPAQLKLDVDQSMAPASKESYHYRLDPDDLLPDPPVITPPDFYPIVSTDALARILHRKLPDDLISGWVIERPTAGGHNAPPRNKNSDGEGNPIYDQKDEADLERIQSLGKPYYLAGGFGTPEKLREAIERGADGIQVGSLFSLADESGYAEADTRRIIRAIHEDRVRIRPDGRISPTGFPFNVVEFEGEPAARDVANRRERICDLGYLREPFLDENENLRGRCPAEPMENYVRKGGERGETEGRACLCNALFANIDLPQQREEGPEPQIFTGGVRLTDLPLGSADSPSFTARDVINYLYG